jgi:hypothetical protein
VTLTKQIGFRWIVPAIAPGRRAALSGVRPPALSGLVPAEQFIVDATKEERLKGLFGPELAEVAELEQTLSEASAIVNLAQVHLKLHSGMDDWAFTELVTPIMTRRNAPWLIKDGDSVVRVRPELKGASGLHQPATPDEIRDGKFYKSEAEYLADRAA